MLQEFYVTITRKIQNPLKADRAREIIRNYFAWPVQINDTETILQASEIEEKYTLSFWDAMIIAAACKIQAEKIFTEDMNSGQIIEGIFLENPLLNP